MLRGTADGAMVNGLRIEPARSAADLEVVGRLFEAYVAGLGVDLAFQDFKGELASLPGKYAPPRGELLLARGHDGEVLGCVGLRPIPPEGTCEMKRLYVAPAARGLGVGRALVEAVIKEARRIGYREMRLDTLADMVEAVGLYRRAGFAPIDPYYHNPISETVYFGLSLGEEARP